VATARDPAEVSRPEEVILRRLVAARAKGDERALREAGRELLTITFDRLRTMVVRESHDRLSREEQEDALQTACIKLGRLVTRANGFRGSTMGEYVNLAKRVVKGACVDTQRSEARHSRRRAELHRTGDGEDGEHYTRKAYEAIRKQSEELEAELAAAGELQELGAAFREWALPRLTPAQREIVECDLEGLAVEQIMERLGKKREAVYKQRERAMDALKKLYEEWER
jgi:RNA polymerase sigma factor (sigma-70 family)